MNWINSGVFLHGTQPTHLRFADNIILIAKVSTELQIIINNLNSADNVFRLKMNLRKIMYNEFIEE